MRQFPPDECDMYVERLTLENYGPCRLIDSEFPFNDDGAPKPLVLVGQNGSGKSLLIANIVNFLLSVKQSIYDKSEMEKGRVYKLRAPSYITNGEKFAYSSIEFKAGPQLYEWVLQKNRQEFEREFQFTPVYKNWTGIPLDSNTMIHHDMRGKDDSYKDIIDNQCVLYFPPNRFEEPAWLNERNLFQKLEHIDKIKISGESNRNIICFSPLRANQNWLYDLVIDRELHEKHFVQIPVNAQTLNVFAGYSGSANNAYEQAIRILRAVMNLGEDLRYGIGPRQTRELAIMRGNENIVPNIFQLSTGQSCLLNLFLSILRDSDCSNSKPSRLEDIEGIVIIDEVEIHLHSLHQRDVLPSLIKLFPKIQFIISSHSPLFLMGLEEQLGTDGVEIWDMPSGHPITTEKFSEFDDAYRSFQASTKYKADLEIAISQSRLPNLIVEGDYDVGYLQKAAEWLGKTALLEKVELREGGGFGNLDKTWNLIGRKQAEFLPQKLILLYDCDVKKEPDSKENFVKWTMPTIAGNPIQKGIENLFSVGLLTRAKAHKSAFIDVYKATEWECRGVLEQIPERWEVNVDEKRNLCDWICANGTREDFENFIPVFEWIEHQLA